MNLPNRDLQQTAALCNKLQYTATRKPAMFKDHSHFGWSVRRCSTLQIIATHRSTLQHTAALYNTLCTHMNNEALGSNSRFCVMNKLTQ